MSTIAHGVHLYPYPDPLTQREVTPICTPVTVMTALWTSIPGKGWSLTHSSIYCRVKGQNLHNWWLQTTQSSWSKF